MPIVDEVQEAITKGKEYYYKIKLPNKTELSVPIWDTGTQEAFLIHVQKAKSMYKALVALVWDRLRLLLWR